MRLKEGCYAIRLIYGSAANGIIVLFAGDARFFRDEINDVFRIDEIHRIAAELNAENEIAVFLGDGERLDVFADVNGSRADLGRFFDNDRFLQCVFYGFDLGSGVSDLHADLVICPTDLVEFRFRLVGLDGAETFGENAVQRIADDLAGHFLGDAEIHKLAKARRADGKRNGEDRLRMRIEALCVPDRKLGTEKSRFHRAVEIEMRNKFKASRLGKFDSYFLRLGQHERSPPK